MRKRWLLALAAAAGVSCLASAHAAKADIFITTHAGQECVQVNTTTPKIRYGLHGAYNDSTSQVTWVCPAENHYSNTQSGASSYTAAYWWAIVDDANGGSDVSCRMEVCSESGTCTSGASRTTSGTGNNLLISTSGASPTALTPSSSTARLICTVPARVGTTGRSGIQKYTTYLF